MIKHSITQSPSGSMQPEGSVILETEFDITEQLLRARMRLKTLSQLSYELKAIDNAYPQNYYAMENSEGMLKMYRLIEEKVLELAENIRNNT